MAVWLQFSACICFLLLFSSSLILNTFCYSVERKIKSKLYTHSSPSSNNTTISIMYVKAEDVKQENIVQFIWSVFETPSIIVAYTSKKENKKSAFGLKINWPNLLKGSKGAITFIEPYDYIVAFEISELYEFQDSNDKVTFSKSDFEVKNHKYSINQTNWQLPRQDRDDVTFYGDFLHGNLSFQCQSSEKDGRDTKAPKQLYSSNSTRFTISLKDLKMNTSDTRLALKLLTHTTQNPHDKTCVMEDQSIDDEYSPGVFRTFFINNTILTSDILSSSISWKPVSYNDEPRELKTQIPSYQYLFDGKHYLLSKVDGDCKPLVSSSNDPPSKVIQAAMDVNKTYPMMVSFGQNKDGWYKKTENLIWCAQVGYGKPRFDTLSLTVLITIIVGLGLPFLFIIAGSIYICIKKYRERMTTSTYGKIN